MRESPTQSVSYRPSHRLGRCRWIDRLTPEFRWIVLVPRNRTLISLWRGSILKCDHKMINEAGITESRVGCVGPFPSLLFGLLVLVIPCGTSTTSEYGRDSTEHDFVSHSPKLSRSRKSSRRVGRVTNLRLSQFVEVTEQQTE